MFPHCTMFPPRARAFKAYNADQVVHRGSIGKRGCRQPVIDDRLLVHVRGRRPGTRSRSPCRTRRPLATPTRVTKSRRRRPIRQSGQARLVTPTHICHQRRPSRQSGTARLVPPTYICHQANTLFFSTSIPVLTMCTGRASIAEARPPLSCAHVCVNHPCCVK